MMRGSAVLTRTGALSMLLPAMVFTFACSTVLGPGKAELPAGIEQARVPDAEYGGFLYVGADPPLTLAPELLRSNSDESTSVVATTTLALRSATIMVGVAGQEFGGAFTFDSTEAAGYALTQLVTYGVDDSLWSKAMPPDLLLVEGDSSWADRWEKMSKAQSTPNHVPGWKAGDAGSVMYPPDYQQLAGPWIDGKPPETQTTKG